MYLVQWGQRNVLTIRIRPARADHDGVEVVGWLRVHLETRQRVRGGETNRSSLNFVLYGKILPFKIPHSSSFFVFVSQYL
jgi:hypothetical protein